MLDFKEAAAFVFAFITDYFTVGLITYCFEVPQWDAWLSLLGLGMGVGSQGAQSSADNIRLQSQHPHVPATHLASPCIHC